MMPSFTRQNENTTNTASYQKRMKTAHGEVKTVNKTGIAKLNKKLKKTGKIEAQDFAEVNYKKVDMTNHKPIVKKKW
jgi:ribosomal protein S6